MIHSPSRFAFSLGGMILGGAMIAVSWPHGHAWIFWLCALFVCTMNLADAIEPWPERLERKESEP